MPVLSSAVSALSTFYQDALDPFNPEQVELSTIRLLAKLPTIAAYAYKKSVGQPLLYPDNSLGLVENFLRMSFGFPAEPYEVEPEAGQGPGPAADPARRPRAELLDVDGPAGRFVATPTCSPRSRPASTPCSGRCTAGPTRPCWRCSEKIRSDGGDVDAFVKRVKNKEPGVKLMGFGHRVYKNYDPRAALVKATADEVLADLGANDELLDLAKQLEAVALSDDYFISRKLYPNVDFYTGLIYKAMGFPDRMFTVLFALGRLPGWIAQWREMINDPATKIGRPRQVYTGYTERGLPAARRSADGRRRRIRPRPGRASSAAGGHDPGMTTRPCCGSAAICGWTTTRRCCRRGRRRRRARAFSSPTTSLLRGVRRAAAGVPGRLPGGAVRVDGRPAAGRPRPTGTGDPAAGARRSARRPCTSRPTTGPTAGAATSGSRRRCRTPTSSW